MSELSPPRRRHIDITIDFETCGLSVNAAPMQLAAVAFDRFVPVPSDVPSDDWNGPFIGETTNVGIDLRTCFMLGLDFDKHTSDWWQQQDPNVIKNVIELDPIPLRNAMEGFVNWVLRVTKDCSSYTIWAQGADFDIAKLNHYMTLTGVRAPWKHTQVRCARTYILEHAHWFMPELSPDDVVTTPNIVYNKIPKMNTIVSKFKHDAVFDCYQTSWNIWQCYQKELSFFRVPKLVPTES